MPTIDIEMPDWITATPRDKLSVEDRFAIYALRHKREISATALAKAFKVSEATVYKITSMRRHKSGKTQHSTYKYAYMEMKAIGLDEMYSRYVTDDMLRRCAALPALSRKAAGRPGPRARALAASGADINANSARGLHELPASGPAGAICTTEIDWVEEGTDYGSTDGENSGPGWYYRFARQSEPKSKWRGNSENGEAFLDSAAALNEVSNPMIYRPADSA